MSLEPCPECAHKISATATSCPSCGARIRRPRGVDTGFHFLYCGLSYRRKFLRTLWITSLSPILLVLPGLRFGHFQLTSFAAFIAVFVTGALQLVYTYVMWKDLEG